MNNAVAAHLRLLESTPRERIRTHERQYEEQAYFQTMRPQRPTSLAKQRRIMELLARGMRQVDIALELDTTESTISKFVKRARAAQRG